MTIRYVTEDSLREVLREGFTPSKEIDTPERLLGRRNSLRDIGRAFNSRGRHAFIYGDRGVGKTSLAVTAASIEASSSGLPIYVACGKTSSFSDVFQAIGNGVIEVEKRFRENKLAGGLKFGIEGMSVAANLSKESATNVPSPKTVQDAIDILKFVSAKGMGRKVVIVDELDRIASEHDRALFAEVIKNGSAVGDDVKIIYCGIGQSVDELLGAHLSVGRYFEPVEVEKLSHDILWRIVSGVAEELEISIPQEFLTRIGVISDGFPHFVHLMGECMIWEMHDDSRELQACERSHFEGGVRGALQRTEPALRLAYQKATEKTKNKSQYEEALWALADTSETRRQIKEIFERSYIRIQNEIGDKKYMDKQTLNARLLTLRDERHGSVVVGHGAGYFSFRENVFRGFVRLKAETEKVPLKRDRT